MIDLLFVKDTEVRRAALLRIREVGQLSTVDAFIAASRVQPQRTMRGAARALVKVLPHGWPRCAAEYLNHREPNYPTCAAELLASAPVSADLLEARALWLAPHSQAAARVVHNLHFALQDGRAPRESTLEALRQASHHPREEVRHRALQALMEQDHGPNQRALIQAYGREGGTLRAALGQRLEQLVRRDPVGFTPHLVALLLEGDEPTQRAAAEVAGMSPQLPRVLEQLLRHSLECPGWQQERALAAARRLDQALLEPSLALMGSADQAVRLQAIALVTELPPDPRMVTPLLEALEQDQWWPRAHAISLLGRLGEPSALEALGQLLAEPSLALLALDALVNSAHLFQEQGRADLAQRALDPLLELLEAGTQEGPEDALQHELRRDILALAVHLPQEALLEALLRTASLDRDPELRQEALKTLQEVAQRLGRPLPEAEVLQLELDAQAVRRHQLTELDIWLKEAAARQAQELHLSSGHPALVRQGRTLRPLYEEEAPLTAHQTAHMLRRLLSPSQAAQVAQDGQVEVCYQVPRGSRHRAQIFVDQRGVNAVFRALPEAPMEPLEAGIPPSFSDAVRWRKGLVLVGGPCGSGRTTTLAALMRKLDQERPCHIIHLASTLEYPLESQSGHISQRSLSEHNQQMADALRAALRQDPDAIFLDELQDGATAALALRAARSGVLVFASLRARHTLGTLQRFLALFPQEERPQVRGHLALSLRAISAQLLLHPQASAPPVAAFETFIVDNQARGALSRGDLELLDQHLQHGAASNRPLDRALLELCLAGRLSPEQGLLHARNKIDFEHLLEQATHG